MPSESHNPRSEHRLSSEGSTDADWIRSIVERFEGPLIVYTRHVLGGDVERARDIVQEAFLRLIGQDGATVRPHVTEWLYTVCRNLAIDVRRKERRMEFLADVDAESATSNDPAPGERAEHEDVLSQVLRKMKLLPLNQQECIRLKFQGGLSYKQISEVTGLTVTNVGFLIHTGLKALRKRVVRAEEPGTEIRAPRAK